MIQRLRVLHLGDLVDLDSTLFGRLQSTVSDLTVDVMRSPIVEFFAEKSLDDVDLVICGQQCDNLTRDGLQHAVKRQANRTLALVRSDDEFANVGSDQHDDDSLVNCSSTLKIFPSPEVAFSDFSDSLVTELLQTLSNRFCASEQTQTPPNFSAPINGLARANGLGNNTPLKDPSALFAPAVVNAELERTSRAFGGLSASFELDLSALFEESPIAEAITDSHWRVLRANKAFHRQFDQTVGVQVGRKMEDFIAPHDRSALSAAQLLAQVSNGFRGVLRAVGVGNSETPMECTMYRLAERCSEPNYIVMLQDISQRISVEHELQEIRQRFEMAIAGSNEGIWDWNLQTDQARFSLRWKEILGFGEDEIAPRISEWFERIHVDDRDKVIETIEAARADQTSHVFELEHRLCHRDGSWKWVIARGTSLLDQHSRPLWFAGSLTDISTRKAAERKSAELQAKLDSLHRLTSMPELGAGISHELRQPICSVMNYADGALLRISQGGLMSPQDMTAVLQSIYEQTVRINDLLDRITQITKPPLISEGRNDIEQLVRDLSPIIQCDLRSNNIRLVIDVDDSAMGVVAEVDAIQIQQVILNLLRNAIQAISGQAILSDGVIDDPSRGHIQLRIARDERFLRICVRNNGPLIPTEILDTLFDPAVTTKQNSFGMGLAICRSVVESHGGQICAENTSHGPHFTFTVPIAE